MGDIAWSCTLVRVCVWCRRVVQGISGALAGFEQERGQFAASTYSRHNACFEGCGPQYLVKSIKINANNKVGTGSTRAADRRSKVRMQTECPV